jgi:hypothetical protein
MTNHTQVARQWTWAGLASGPGAWAASTQLNYALAPFTCTQYRIAVTAIALVLLLVAAAGAVLSWRSLRQESAPGPADTRGGHPHRLLGLLGMTAGVLFAVVIGVQAAAGLVLDACLR